MQANAELTQRNSNQVNTLRNGTTQSGLQEEWATSENTKNMTGLI